MTELESQEVENAAKIVELTQKLSSKHTLDTAINSEIEKLKSENKKLAAERDQKIASLEDLSMKIKIANNSANDQTQESDFVSEISRKDEEIKRLRNLLEDIQTNQKDKNDELVSNLDSEYLTQLQSEITGQDSKNFQKYQNFKSLNFVFFCTVKILKSGKVFSCFAFADSSPYCDMWLSCLSRATTPHPPRFSKSTW